MLPLDQFAGRTLPGFVMLILFTMLASCSKEPVADLTGNWKIDKQLTAHYAGFEQTGENISDLCNAYMTFNGNGTGIIINAEHELFFSYKITSEELILSTETCKRSTWYIAEYTGENLVIEHNYPSMVTVRYLSKIH